MNFNSTQNITQAKVTSLKLFRLKATEEGDNQKEQRGNNTFGKMKTRHSNAQ